MWARYIVEILWLFSSLYLIVQYMRHFLIYRVLQMLATKLHVQVISDVWGFQLGIQWASEIFSMNQGEFVVSQLVYFFPMNYWQEKINV